MHSKIKFKKKFACIKQVFFYNCNFLFNNLIIEIHSKVQGQIQEYLQIRLTI